MVSKNSRFQIAVWCAMVFMLVTGQSFGQVAAPGSAWSGPTNYTGFPTNDPVYVFCASPGENIATLQVTTQLEGAKTFTWARYNPETHEFTALSSEPSNGNQSQMTNLADGGYRITVSTETGQEVYRAWVFNFWREITAGISESTCDYVTLGVTQEQADLVYYDLGTGVPIELNANVQFQWRTGETIVAAVQSPVIYDPPTANTDYTVTVTDLFGCEVSATITYISIVTKAAFTADPMSGEAPLIVNFKNNSENADSYEWFFFKDLDEIKRSGPGVDSILAGPYYDQNPVYTYEKSGLYMVKLVAHKNSELWTCTDTAYLETYIVADTSYIDAPNFFTPDGNGTNDFFIVQFWSMEKIKVSIFNRWGRTVHVFEDNNVRGLDTRKVSAWDGRINGREASPGVYFYVVEGTGRDVTTRDGKTIKRYKRGFVHLFREGN